jgi:MoxR-like ATPase
MTQNTDVLAKVTALGDDLNQSLLERDGVVECAVLALVLHEHLLMLGPPGTAKTYLAKSVCERVTGADFYSHLLTKFTTPDELFGPLSLSALEQDEFRRVTTGMLPEAHIAVLDEIWKSNSAVLNSLLSIVLERQYGEGGRMLPVPLLSLFAASNETPEDDSLNALYDRFLLRVVVPPLADDQSLRALFDLQPSAPTATITLDELREAQEQVGQVQLTDDTIEAAIAIKHGLEEEGIAASDRRWKACADLVRAKAWLEGESQTSSDHCEVLVHALWSEPSQIRLVERVVSKVANPLNLEAVELEDAAQDLYDQRPQPDHPDLTQALEPLLKQLGDIHTRLEQRVQAVPAKRALRARQALAKVETYHRALSQLALRSLSKLHMAPGAA